MFKKYRFVWTGRDGSANTLDFFVHSKKTRHGFLHRACAIGPIPRLDETDGDWSAFRANMDRLCKKRLCKVPYSNRTWEAWPGHDCLVRLWDQLAALKFVDLSEVAQTNPFACDTEPDHEELYEADELFNMLKAK